MKEFKKDELLPINVLKTKIWSMFDILRNQGISSDAYHVILLFLSAYRDGVISTDLLKEGYYPKDKLIDKIEGKEHQLSSQYSSIFQSFQPIVRLFSERALMDIIIALGELNLKILSENYSHIFDSVLYRISQSQGRFTGDFIQPIELTRFICDIADLPPNAQVYNPFAGLASFGVYLGQGHDYYGQEINRITWALGALRIMAHARPGKSKYILSDSIIDWPKTEKYDLIVANPPFRMQHVEHYRDIRPDFKSTEQFLIEKGLQSLNRDGKLIALLPQGILYRGSHEAHLREFLVDADLIDTIISLPGGLLLNTGIPLVIMILSKNKIRPGKIRFVDAKKFIVAKSPKEKMLNDYDLSSVLRGDNLATEVIQIVDVEQIKSDSYNLNVPRYFQKHIEGVKLKDILKFLKGNRVNLVEAGKLVRIRDLKDDKVDFKLDIAMVETTEFNRVASQEINESCLLLAVRWRSLKPTLFEFDDEPIYRRQDILSFKINEDLVDKAYLINELHADYVQEQFESYRLGGSFISTLRRDDLLEVIIKLPTLVEQRAKVEGIDELSVKIKSLEVERHALVRGQSVKQFNEFASLKHTLGRPRQNILDWSDNLLDFLQSKHEDINTLNKTFSEFYEIDIFSALREIKRDVNFMTEVLEKGENGFLLDQYDKYTIPLSDINSIINELSNNGYKFKIKKLLLKGEKLKERGIIANKTLLKTLLDNILTNANKYAFENKNTGNEVVMELTEVDDLLSLEIKNNGKPFSNNFTREKFITKYSTADSISGTGLGGYDVHRIASDFNNSDWELSLNEDPFYPVKFKFQFSIKLIN